MTFRIRLVRLMMLTLEPAARIYSTEDHGARQLQFHFASSLLQALNTSNS
jgi:hypothetical protein